MTVPWVCLHYASIIGTCLVLILGVCYDSAWACLHYASIIGTCLVLILGVCYDSALGLSTLC